MTLSTLKQKTVARLSESYGPVLKQGFRYFVIGVSSALLELLLFLGLYELLGFPGAPSNIIAVACATAFNFALNRTWSFKSASSLGSNLVKYLVLFIFNTCFSTLTILWLIGLGMPSVLAKLITMACIVCWNFVLYRKVIFK